MDVSVVLVHAPSHVLLVRHKLTPCISPTLIRANPALFDPDWLRCLRLSHHKARTHCANDRHMSISSQTYWKGHSLVVDRCVCSTWSVFGCFIRTTCAISNIAKPCQHSLPRHYNVYPSYFKREMEVLLRFTSTHCCSEYHAGR